MEHAQRATFDDDEWVIIDHGTSDQPTERIEKASFLDILMRNCEDCENGSMNTANIPRARYVSGGKQTRGTPSTTRPATPPGSSSLEEEDFAEEYYAGKKERDAARSQGINRLPYSSKMAKDRRLSAKAT